MDMTKNTAMLKTLADGLFAANSQVDMSKANIDVQEQYRLNAETILAISRILGDDFT